MSNSALGTINSVLPQSRHTNSSGNTKTGPLPAFLRPGKWMSTYASPSRFRLTKTGLSPDTFRCNALRGMVNTWLLLLIWLRFLAKSVSFGLRRLRWRAQSSSRSSLLGRLRSFISSVTHTPSRKYALWSSFGHASLGNSKPAVSQRSSNRRSSSCSWTRCVVVVVSFFLLIDVIFGLASVLPCTA
jgi:hypothetical protein